MANMSIRNIPDEDMTALKRLAAQNNRSAEAEVRHAIAQLVRKAAGKGFGTRLRQQYGGAIDDDFEFQRDQMPLRPTPLG